MRMSRHHWISKCTEVKLGGGGQPLYESITLAILSMKDFDAPESQRGIFLYLVMFLDKLSLWEIFNGDFIVELLLWFVCWLSKIYCIFCSQSASLYAYRNGCCLLLKYIYTSIENIWIGILSQYYIWAGAKGDACHLNNAEQDIGPFHTWPFSTQQSS